MTKRLSRLINQMQKLRITEGLSIRSLAKITGVSFSSLSRLERGIGEPDMATKERIERWVTSGEGSSPHHRGTAAHWSVKVEQRLAALERHVFGEDGT